MHCEKCKSDFKEPLQTYDRTRYCPVCLDRLQASKVYLTAENMAAYTQSELLFSKCNYREALKLCSTAALQGNPYAIINMGFYYENQYFPTADNDDRIREAFARYDIVAMYKDDYRALRTLSDNQPRDEVFDETLIDCAIKNILCLFVNNSSGASSKFVLDSQFNLPRKKTVARLAETVGVPLDEFQTESAGEPTPCTLRALYDTITSNAVMGYRKIDLPTAEEMTGPENRAETESLLERYEIGFYTSYGIVLARNIRNLESVVEDFKSNPDGTTLVIGYCLRDKKRLTHRKKYEGGRVRITVQTPAVKAFFDALPDAIKERRFGDGVVLTKTDLLIAQKYELNDILGLC